MADKTDDLIISVSTDLTTIKRQLRQLGQSVTQATTGASKKFVDFGKQIDQSLTPIQKRINNMVGIPMPTGIKEWKGALADVAKETELVTRGVRLNRVGMMELQAAGVNTFQALASGMSIERVAMMEGAQVIGAVVQGFEGLGARIVALATPANLVAAGIAAAGTALIAYSVGGGESIEKLDDILKRHKETIDLLGDAYDKAAEKQQKSGIISTQVAKMIAANDAKKLSDALSAALSNIYNSATDVQLTSIAGALSTESVVKTIYQPFAKAIEDLNNSAKDSAALKDFQNTIAAIVAANPQYAQAGNALQGMANEAAKIAQALPGVANSVSDVTAAVAAMNEALDAGARSGFSQLSDEQTKYIQDLIEKLKGGQISAEDFRAALASLDGITPDFSGAISQVSGLADQLERAQRAALGLANTTPKQGRVGVNPFDEAQKQYDAAFSLASRIGIDGITPDSTKPPKTPRQPRTPIPRRTADDRFAEDIKSIQARTTALAQERGLLGATYEEQMRVNTAYDLTQKALREVREEARRKGDQDWQNAKLSDEQKAKIDAVSDSYAKQAAALKKAQEEMQFEQDIVKGVLDDIHSALEDGKITTQEWGKIFLNVLDKIINKLENDFIDALFAANNAGGGGGSLLGGLFKGIGSLFSGGGGGGLGEASGFGNSYALGGYTGAGGKFETAGLVHKGEVVWSQTDVARAGGVGMAEALRRGAVPVARGGGSTVVNYSPTIDARGADSAAVARIQDTLARDKAEFSVKVLAAVRKAKKSNEKGL